MGRAALYSELCRKSGEEHGGGSRMLLLKGHLGDLCRQPSRDHQVIRWAAKPKSAVPQGTSGVGVGVTW
jgi:hypothetical protein